MQLLTLDLFMFLSELLYNQRVKKGMSTELSFSKQQIIAYKRRFESHSTHFLPCDINLIPTLDSPQKWSNLRLFCDEQNESKDGDGEAEVHDNRGGHGRRLHALDDEVLRPERRQEKAEVNIEFYGDYPKNPECFIKILS